MLTKIIFIASCLLLYGHTALALDTITLRDGTVIYGEISDFTEHAIVFKKEDDKKIGLTFRQIKKVESEDQRKHKKILIEMITEEITAFGKKQADRKQKQSPLQYGNTPQQQKKYIPYTMASPEQKKHFPSKEVSSRQTQVHIYTRSGCPYTLGTLKFLRQHQIKYTKHDIERDRRAQLVFERHHATHTPLIVINGQVVHSLKPDDIITAYRQASQLP